MDLSPSGDIFSTSTNRKPSFIRKLSTTMRALPRAVVVVFASCSGLFLNAFCSAFVRLDTPAILRSSPTGSLSRSKLWRDANGLVGGGEDWRAVRARLVQNENSSKSIQDELGV